MTRTRPVIHRRPMTAEEISMALAVSPLHVGFGQSCDMERFAWMMSENARQPLAPMITETQGALLVTVVLRFRRQVPADVLAIATRSAAHRLPRTPPARTS